MTETSVTRQDAVKALRSHLRRIEQALGSVDDAVNMKGRGSFDDVLTALGHLRGIELATKTAQHWLALIAADAGASWRQIGDELDITRQAAQQRYGSMLIDRPIPGIEPPSAPAA